MINSYSVFNFLILKYSSYYTYLYKYITDYSNDNQAVNISASSGVNQPDNFSINIATVQYVSNDEASGDRAEKCFISNHCQCNGRRRFVTLQVTTTGKYIQCWICIYYMLLCVLYSESLTMWLHCDIIVVHMYNLLACLSFDWWLVRSAIKLISHFLLLLILRIKGTHCLCLLLLKTYFHPWVMPLSVPTYVSGFWCEISSHFYWEIYRDNPCFSGWLFCKFPRQFSRHYSLYHVIKWINLYVQNGYKATSTYIQLACKTWAALR